MNSIWITLLKLAASKVTALKNVQPEAIQVDGETCYGVRVGQVIVLIDPTP